MENKQLEEIKKLNAYAAKCQKKIKGKIEYWSSQESKFTGRFIQSMKRFDRDELIKVREKIVVYNEIMEILKTE